MTIQELYDWAVSHNVTQYEMAMIRHDDESEPFNDNIDEWNEWWEASKHPIFDIDDETKQVFIS